MILQGGAAADRAATMINQRVIVPMKTPTSRPREQCLAELASGYRPLAPGQTYEVDQFRPGDAPGIARLYFGAYGEHFPIDYVYDPEAIIALNAGPDLYHVVARAPSGDVLGTTALFRTAPGQTIMESGSVIVDPTYSGRKLLLQMHQLVNIELPRRLGLNAVFGQMVCDNLVTQKLMVHLGAFPQAIEIAALPDRPAERRFGVTGRISLLDGFLLLKDPPQDLYPPAPYAEWIKSRYAEHHLTRHFHPDQQPTSPATRSQVEDNRNAALTKMTVLEIGQDFATCLAHVTTTHPDTLIWQLLLPLDRPGGGFAVAAARAQGFFLGGLLPLWSDHDMLLVQKIAIPFDPEQIHLLTEESKTLLGFILDDQRSLSSPDGAG